MTTSLELDGTLSVTARRSLFCLLWVGAERTKRGLDKQGC